MDGALWSTVSSDHLTFASLEIAQRKLAEIQSVMAETGKFPTFSQLAPSREEAAILRQGALAAVILGPETTYADHGRNIRAYGAARADHQSKIALIARGYLVGTAIAGQLRTTDAGVAFLAMREAPPPVRLVA